MTLPFSRRRGVTLTELLVAIVIVAILSVVVATNLASSTNSARRDLENYSLKLLGDLRWAVHRAAQLGEDLVVEVIGEYDNRPGGNVSHRLPLEDTIRIWRRADWDRYRIQGNHLACAPILDCLAPYLVYDLSAGGPLDADGNGLISEDELPVPLREYVPEDYRDPTTLLSLPQYQVVLNSPKFQRFKAIPRDLDLLAPAFDEVGYTADPGNYRHYVSYAFVRPAGSGIRGAGVLEFALVVEPEAYTDTGATTGHYVCNFEGQVRNEANGRTVQMLLATGDLRVVAAAPSEYMRPATVPSVCSGGPSAPLVYDRGGGWE